jgi:hypothetical protein
MLSAATPLVREARKKLRLAAPEQTAAGSKDASKHKSGGARDVTHAPPPTPVSPRVPALGTPFYSPGAEPCERNRILAVPRHCPHCLKTSDTHNRHQTHKSRCIYRPSRAKR